MATPRFISARPYNVGSTPNAPRSSRRTPNACSRSAIDREIAGCEVASSFAALPMLPASITDTRIRRSRRLTRRSSRRSLLIAHLISDRIWLHRAITIPGRFADGYRRVVQLSKERAMRWRIRSLAVALLSSSAVQAEQPRDIAPRTELYSIETLTLSDEQFLKGEASGKPVTISAQLRIAQGTGRLPLVILQHGSSGY